jgi:2,3-bisphosphoglycerate-independent phosphoglycerate mutase
MKYVVLQGDGMADEPVAELGGKTPLESARTPHLDHMASRGILGLTRTIPRGTAPASEVGILSVLGYDPARHPGGRAPLEAASLGITLGSADVAFCCNLVTLETPEGGVEIMRDFAAGHPSPAEGREIVADLGRELADDGLEVHPGAGYRHLLVWRSGESRMRTVPPHDLADKPVSGALPEGPGAEVLRALIERSRARLAAHPLCQDAPRAFRRRGVGDRGRRPGERARRPRRAPPRRRPRRHRLHRHRFPGQGGVRAPRP